MIFGHLKRRFVAVILAPAALTALGVVSDVLWGVAGIFGPGQLASPPTVQIQSPFSEKQIVSERLPGLPEKCYALGFLDQTSWSHFRTSSIVDSIKARLDRLDNIPLQESLDLECAQAVALEQLNRARAQAIYESIIARDSSHIGALLGLARLASPAPQANTFLQRAEAAVDARQSAYAIPYILLGRFSVIPPDEKEEGVSILQNIVDISVILELDEVAAISSYLKATLQFDPTKINRVLPKEQRDRIIIAAIERHAKTCESIKTREAYALCPYFRGSLLHKAKMLTLAQEALQEAISVSQQFDMKFLEAVFRVDYAKEYIHEYAEKEREYSAILEELSPALGPFIRGRILVDLANIASFDRQNPRLAFERMKEPRRIFSELSAAGTPNEYYDRMNAAYAGSAANYASRAGYPEEAMRAYWDAFILVRRWNATLNDLPVYGNLIQATHLTIAPDDMREAAKVLLEEFDPKHYKLIVDMLAQPKENTEVAAVALLSFREMIQKLGLDTKNFSHNEMLELIYNNGAQIPEFIKWHLDRFCRRTRSEDEKSAGKYGEDCISSYKMLSRMLDYKYFSTPDEKEFTEESETFESFLNKHKQTMFPEDDPVDCTQQTYADFDPYSDKTISDMPMFAPFKLNRAVKEAIACGPHDRIAMLLTYIKNDWATRRIAAYEWSSYHQTMVEAANALQSYDDLLMLRCTAYTLSESDYGWFRNEPDVFLFLLSTLLKDHPDEVKAAGWSDEHEQGFQREALRRCVVDAKDESRSRNMRYTCAAAIAGVLEVYRFNVVKGLIDPNKDNSGFPEIVRTHLHNYEQMVQWPKNTSFCDDHSVLPVLQ